MNRQMVSAALLLAAAILLVVEVPLGIVYTRSAQERLLSEVERDARVLAALIEQELVADDLSSVSRITDRYAERTDGRVVVTDLNGVAVVDTAGDRTTTNDFSDRPEVIAALAGSQDSAIADSDIFNEEFGYVAVPIFSNAEIIGAMRVSEPTEDMRGRIRGTWTMLGVLAVAVLAAAAAGAWFIARWALRPIATLERGALRLASGELSERTRVRRGPPELRHLSSTFDDMAARLEVLITSQQKFIADASHQLRTPLTALHLRIESIEDRLRNASAEGTPDGEQLAMERDLEAVTAELERLSELVDRLLELARTEATAALRQVDLAHLAQDAVDRWLPVAEARSVCLHYEGAKAAPVREATGAVAQILDNLIDNAITASPPDGDIAVTVLPPDEPGGPTTLRVRDHGPGMTEEQLARAADRFWRAPGAPPGGSGLGLSIVVELAALSNGDVRLSRPDGGGLLAEVELPTAGTDV